MVPRVLLEARVDFVNTVLIPVILILVVTASVFYDAYQSLGDNDTAHSLAFGLLYSWLIILAVASNCYTGSLTYSLLDWTRRERNTNSTSPGFTGFTLYATPPSS